MWTVKKFKMLVGRAGAAACTIAIPKEEVVQRSAQTGTAAEQRYTKCDWTVQLYQAMLTRSLGLGASGGSRLAMLQGCWSVLAKECLEKLLVQLLCLPRERVRPELVEKAQ